MQKKAYWYRHPYGGNGTITKMLLVMKLTIVLLTAVFLNVHATGTSQRISFAGKDVPLLEIFNAIKKQTGYVVFCDKKDLNGTTPVTLSAQNMLLNEFLENALKDQGLQFIIEGKTVVLSRKSSSGYPVNPEQPEGVWFIPITGIVRNNSGEPLPGATVRIKGKSVIKITDQKGYFDLTANAEDILIVSYVGYKTVEIPLKNAAMPLEIKLSLETGEYETVDVVNTGYQTIPKERATGSFEKIDNATLNQQVGTNILNRLNGAVSGLLFNVDKKYNNIREKTNISVRGLSTINGPLDPLIVLDNFIYEGSFDNINPNDVESVTVLKDAAATSIYGARGGNGVIVITTKKGRFNQKVRIDVNSNLIIGEKPNLFYSPEISSPDYINVEEMLFNKGYKLSDTSSVLRVALTPVYEILLKRRKGLISAVDSANQINALKAIDSRDQYNKYFYRNAVTQTHAINLRGGSDNIAWVLSGGYDKVISNLDAKSDKLNLRVYNEYRPVKNISLTVGVYYTNATDKTGKPGYNTIKINTRSVPYLQFADDNGNALSVNTFMRGGYTDTVGAGKLLDWKYYPLEDYKHNITTTRREDFTANLGISYKIIDGLTVDIKYQRQRESRTITGLSDLQSYAARHTINTYSQLNRATGIVTYKVPMGSILYYKGESISSYNATGMLNFNRIWGQHELVVMAGVEARELGTKANDGTTYGYNEDPLTYGRVDFVTPHPTFITGGSSPISGAPRYYSYTNRFVGMYSNLSYTWKRKYIFSASGRKDGSNVFGAGTNEKWTPLWSTGLAWNLSMEDFYKVSLVPSLKLRVTYGYSGNVDPARVALPIAQMGNDGLTNLPRAIIRTPSNPDLRWEKVGMFNIAVDFALKKNRVNGSIDFYKKHAIDLYGNTPYDYTLWGTSPYITRNVASIAVTGIDATFNTRNIDRAIKWNTHIVFSYYRDKTLKYFTPEADKVSGIIGGGRTIAPVIGKPLYAVAAYRWGGLDNTGDPLGYLNGGKSKDYTAILREGATKGEAGGVVYIGTTSPAFYGSLQNSISWKGFTASASITYKLGYYFKRPVLSYSGVITTGAGHPDFVKRWQKPGDELITSVPAFKYPDNIPDKESIYQNAEIHVLRGDHLRLLFINLNYAVPANTLKYLHINDLQFYCNIANPGILWRANKESIDPDAAFTIPTPKTIALGMRVGF